MARVAAASLNSHAPPRSPAHRGVSLGAFLARLVVIGLYVLWAVLTLTMLLLLVGAVHELDAIRRYGGAEGAAVWTFMLNACAFGGLVFLAMTRLNPLHWIGRTRLILAGLSLAFVISRPFLGWVGPLLSALGLPSALVGWLGILFAPPLMVLVGMVVVVTVAYAIGSVAAILVGFPVMVFGLILQVENQLQTYRVQESYVMQYLLRFSYWLRGERPPPAGPDESKGARFATKSEIEAFIDNDPASFNFGHTEE